MSWYQKWHAPLRDYLSSRGAARTDIEDIAQEVFLRLLRYDRSHLVENPKAYLFKMASNLAAELSMRARSRSPHDSSWLAELAGEDDPERRVYEADVQDQVQRALKALAPRQRTILKLRMHEDLTIVEISERLRITERMVRRDLAKSYARLRCALNPELLELFL